MVKAYRSWTKTENRRYKLVKEKLLELGRKDGEITSAELAEFGAFSVGTARRWLAIFETDGIIKLNRMKQAGERVYVIVVV